MRTVSIVVLLAAVALVADRAYAQTSDGPYVSASLVGDVVRRGSVRTGNVSQDAGSGEALGLSLRVGTPLGASWGVEAEFARSGALESESSDIFPLALTTYTFANGALGDYAGLPRFGWRSRTEERWTSFSGALWLRQPVSDSVSLVYLGGMAFHKTEQTTSFAFDRRVGPASLPIGPGAESILPFPSETTVTSYAVRPFMGVEARIGMTDHAALVPSLRLHGIEGGVLVRPSVGLQWSF